MVQRTYYIPPHAVQHCPLLPHSYTFKAIVKGFRSTFYAWVPNRLVISAHLQSKSHGDNSTDDTAGTAKSGSSTSAAGRRRGGRGFGTTRGRGRSLTGSGATGGSRAGRSISAGRAARAARATRAARAARGSGRGGSAAAAGRGAAGDDVGGIAVAGADLLGEINGLLLAGGVAGVGNAAGNVANEVGVGADALEVEQLAVAADQAAGRELLDAGLLIEVNTISIPEVSLIETLRQLQQ